MTLAWLPKESQRADFFLFIDEFASFTSDSFASILAENRKYRCRLTLSGQHLSQASEEVRDAIIGNVGNIISFRVSAAAANPALQKSATTKGQQNRFQKLSWQMLKFGQIV